MKKMILMMGMLAITSILFAQAKMENLPPYKKDPKMPNFRILLTDSTTWFTKDQLPKTDYTAIIYFSPDCGHCQHEAKEVVKYMDSLKNVFFVWVNYRHTMNDLKAFSEYYGLDKFSNVRMGRDPQYAIPAFYQVKFTPFVAVYDKNRLFMKEFETGVEMPELLSLLRNHR
ncbi:TlpA family protein disulfide reductase [Sediminibacterium ginsengisoli]|uniref:Thioredoxin-like n=1 Tax=Sediminibacterium ginsengisoli TaxID=413434 RepID=A0A1T4KAI9_9BACT|nr:thioredoxin-like domain-containing protein [Sediminibacterium ginsengisoli]SJZ39478.1 Thioredoxin-like [Sediminibacterium ginsengisoli]